jgi:hypothetical protein
MTGRIKKVGDVNYLLRPIAALHPSLRCNANASRHGANIVKNCLSDAGMTRIPHIVSENIEKFRSIISERTAAKIKRTKT